MSAKLLRQWLEYIGFRCVVCLLQLLSARQTARIANTLGWVFTDVLPKKLTRYQVAYDNIARAFRSCETPSSTSTPVLVSHWIGSRTRRTS